LTTPRLPESSRARVGVALVLFVYLAILRTRHISETFQLMGDQILYWRIALGSWRSLSLGGGPSSVGGTTLGPAFTWMLWGIRHAVGPWTDNLPHAGGIGISIVQAAADAVLFVAIWKRFASPALALAVTLFVATAPFDMSLSATIWNPPVAVALVKLTIAFVLLGDRDPSLWWAVAATAAAILAVQTHSSAVFVAVPAIVSFSARELLAERKRRAWMYALASAAVFVVLEVPFALDLATHPGKQTSPPLVANSVMHTVAHPETLRPAAAFRALAASCDFILLRPWSFAWFASLLAACAAIVAVRARRDVALACVTVVPLVCAVAGFSFWQLPYDSYWFLTIAPSAALTIGLALTAWPPAAPVVSAALALLVLAAQPPRFADAMTLNRLPQYGALVRGSKEIWHRASEVHSLETQLALPPSTDPHFVYEILGGRVTPGAPLAATIDPAGHASFAP
jgi:hypothetical protein